MKSFWQNCLAQLKIDLPPQQYDTWIKPLTPLGYGEGIMSIAAPNPMKRDWVKSRFSGRLAALASQYWHEPVEIRFVLEKQGKPVSPSLSPQPKAINGTATASAHNQSATAPAKPQRAQNSINHDMTFDSFVVGKANQLARAAAIQVANNPGSSYNPLYLHGGVGLGKTHLIHAIGNHIMQEKPKARIRYIHSEGYVRDVVSAYQKKGFDEFQRYYRTLDVLLIDDIQFLTGKQRSTEEFFYLFEALFREKKQLVITGESHPGEISGLDGRITSRLSSGLTVEVEPPELEMRVAILLKKANLEDARLPDDVAFFVASQVRSNVRELEGALRKMLAYSRFHGKPITVDLARDSLKDLLAANSNKTTIENIQKTVADFYRIKLADMLSKRRTANLARPRQIAMYLTKELTQHSLPEIGKRFGGRDHTTVLHAVKKITQERVRNQELARELHVLKQMLES
ncbi:MAG: chromosomal replication initiator protein DnaA [Burkholderiaceae bacterium]|jgi:chromosomal replication initiator protein|nr:chromosomal replication initiator protein DnaA [Burkholderiaceae bacterium]